MAAHGGVPLVRLDPFVPAAELQQQLSLRIENHDMHHTVNERWVAVARLARRLLPSGDAFGQVAGINLDLEGTLLVAGLPNNDVPAVNAGGVAVSGLEMSQNSMKLAWPAEEVDEKLHRIMVNIHAAGVENGLEDDGYINYMKGSNIAGFRKVADAMLELGY